MRGFVKHTDGSFETDESVLFIEVSIYNLPNLDTVVQMSEVSSVCKSVGIWDKLKCTCCLHVNIHFYMNII